jgi:predicted  nucleic acid-binding Zn-ribbon protein
LAARFVSGRGAGKSRGVPSNENKRRNTVRTDPLAEEIRDVRERLSKIEEERDRLPEDSVTERADLKKEEHELRARLIRLQDARLRPWDTAELPGIPG